MDTIGRYEVVEELGKGAMGVVYKAIDPTIGRDVALKTVRLDVHGVEADEVLRRFRNEARAAGTLSHPNIVTIFDAGEHQGVFYMAMEYIAGETLASMMAARRTFAVEEVLSVARQVCAGLDYAHGRGVIHRDVKPANIMVAADGAVKIMDFGIAKLGGSMTLTGPVMGTPNYMSPEQVKGKPLDGRSDLFSLGVMLYEMLTGAKPFTGDNVTTIIYQIVHEKPVAPRENDLSIHTGLSAVAARAWAKSPGERYQTGAELIRDLENYKSLALNAGGATMVVQALREEESPDPMVEEAGGEESHEEAAAKVTATATDSTAAGWPSTAGKVAVILALLLLMRGGMGWWIHGRRPVPQAAEAVQSASAPMAVNVPQEASITKPTESSLPAEVAAGAVAVAPKSRTTGTLQLQSVPDGAIVQIDGKSSDDWLTPFTVSNLKPGVHTVSAAHSGVQSAKRTVTVVAGKPTVVNFKFPAAVAALARESAEAKRPAKPEQNSANPISKLKRLFRGDQPPPNKGLLLVRTRPKGAQVLVDEFVAPELTPARVPVDAGTYHVIVNLPGYKPIHRLVTIENGKSRKLNLAFVPE